MPPADDGQNGDSCLIRVSDHVKIGPCVSFALSVLEAHEDRPITFHTLPAKLSQSDTSDGSTSTPSTSKVTTTVPRLISIVEIIKREFLKSLATKRSPRLEGLHQYNELVCLEDIGIVTSEAEDRAATLRMALEGKNHVKQNQIPYMKITLSHKPLPELVEKGATHQPPTVRKISKSSKTRLKKRERLAKKISESTPVPEADTIS